MELRAVRTYSLSGLPINLTLKQSPELILIKGELPPTLRPGTIERAVQSLINEIEINGDPIGFFNSTIESIANATFLKKGGDFWLVEEDGEAVAYALGSTCPDVDGSMTYHLPQAWVHKRFRRKEIVKEWVRQIRARAKNCLAKYILITASRNPAAFSRWLGNGTHIYATILKENLNG